MPFNSYLTIRGAKNGSLRLLAWIKKPEVRAVETEKTAELTQNIYEERDPTMEIPDNAQTDATPTQKAIDITIRLTLLAALLSFCFLILKPFVLPVIWGIIVAITLYPVFEILNAKIGNRRKLTAAAMTILALRQEIAELRRGYGKPLPDEAAIGEGDNWLVPPRRKQRRGRSGRRGLVPPRGPNEAGGACERQFGTSRKATTS